MPLIVVLVVLPLAWWWGIATKWQYPNINNVGLIQQYITYETATYLLLLLVI
jgi:hypothetical protein